MKHRVSDLATPDPSPITSLSNPQKHALYTLIASVRPKPIDVKPHDTGVDYYYAKGHDKALQDYDNAIKEILGETT